MENIFLPPKPITPLPADQIDQAYKVRRRWNFSGIFAGYCASYLVRSQLLSLAIPMIMASGVATRSQLGDVLAAFPIAYGLSKFLMGNVSDRSNPRYFLALGLILSALPNLILGVSMKIFSCFTLMWLVQFVCGWGNGMCYPPCSRILSHWYTLRERSTAMTLWNISHNLGGFVAPMLFTWAVALFNLPQIRAIWPHSDWSGGFLLPAILTLVTVVFVIWSIRDTPQSVGLPAIEEYRREESGVAPAVVKTNTEEVEEELSAKDIFFKHIFNNRALWLLSIANVFVYFVRFGVLNWIPAYLAEVKHYGLAMRAAAMFAFEMGGIPAIVLCGLASHYFFRDRRTPVVAISMGCTVVGILMYWLTPPGYIYLDYAALIITGFFIYGPVVFLGMQAVDVVYKKAVGTATGMTGFFGYFLGASCAGSIIGRVVQHLGWDAGFYLLIAACIAAILCLIPIWNVGGENYRVSSDGKVISK